MKIKYSLLINRKQKKRKKQSKCLTIGGMDKYIRGYVFSGILYNH